MGSVQDSSALGSEHLDLPITGNEQIEPAQHLSLMKDQQLEPVQESASAGNNQELTTVETQSMEEPKPHWSEDQELRNSMVEPFLSKFDKQVQKYKSSIKKYQSDDINIPPQSKADKYRIQREEGEQMVSEEDSKELEDSRPTVSPFQFRTYSTIRGAGGCSVGYSSPYGYWPYGYLTGANQFNRVEDIPKGAGAKMIGNHLSWVDVRRTSGEFQSWTNSALFALQHAMGKQEKGERGVYVAGGETAKLQSAGRTPGNFYPAVVLHNIFGVLDISWIEGSGRPMNWSFRLHERKFTHESLAFGELRDVLQAVKHVKLEDLVLKGLFWIFPELQIEGPYSREGLYDSLLAYRRINYIEIRSPIPITRLEVLVAFRLAKLFMRDLDGEKVPVYAFLWFLCLKKHDIAGSHEFAAFIWAHYEAEDIEALYYQDMGKIPDNLQELVEFIALARRAAEVLHAKPVPLTVLVRGSKYRKEVFYRKDDLEEERKKGREAALTKEENDFERQLLMDVMVKEKCHKKGEGGERRRDILANKLENKSKVAREAILMLILRNSLEEKHADGDDGSATTNSEDEIQSLMSKYATRPEAAKQAILIAIMKDGFKDKEIDTGFVKSLAKALVRKSTSARKDMLIKILNEGLKALDADGFTPAGTTDPESGADEEGVESENSTEEQGIETEHSIQAVETDEIMADRNPSAESETQEEQVGDGKADEGLIATTDLIEGKTKNMEGYDEEHTTTVSEVTGPKDEEDNPEESMMWKSGTGNNDVQAPEVGDGGEGVQEPVAAEGVTPSGGDTKRKRNEIDTVDGEPSAKRVKISNGNLTEALDYIAGSDSDEDGDESEADKGEANEGEGEEHITALEPQLHARVGHTFDRGKKYYAVKRDLDTLAGQIRRRLESRTELEALHDKFLVDLPALEAIAAMEDWMWVE